MEENEANRKFVDNMPHPFGKIISHVHVVGMPESRRQDTESLEFIKIRIKR